MFRPCASGEDPAVPSPAVRPPVSSLMDSRGRRLDYLRLAVTDLCNLRCRYCMPAEGVPAVSHGEILSHEESLRLVGLLCRMGVRKIRITGGEPLVRRGVVDLVTRLAALPSRPEVLLTTNGLLLTEHLDALVAAGLRRVNLSLDSLDPDTWRRITRRGGFAAARGAVDAVLARGLGLKLNVVVLAGVNDHELSDFVALTRDMPLDVRFIESMPFSGPGGDPHLPLSGAEIMRRLGENHSLDPVDGDPRAVARLFRVPGHAGRLGVIEGHTRSFCGTCNRLRVDARGRLRTCLYGRPALDLRALMRDDADDEAIAAALIGAVAGRRHDGHAAQGHTVQLASMARIGG